MQQTNMRPNTIAECLAQSNRLFESDSARLDVELMLAHVLSQGRAYLFTWPDKVLDKTHVQTFLSLLSRREKGEPIAYILGTQAFWTLDLDVNESTLIPRPETELLIELVLDRATDEANILDLGTGTGAIALSLASELSDAQVLGVDKSDDAVLLAEKNKAKNGIHNAQFKQSDWFNDVEGCFDIIVTNPPYIEENDPHLRQGDVRFEPESALVSGVDGLNDIRRIIKHSKDRLFDKGWLLIEHGYNQAEAIQRLFIQAGFDQVNTVKDLGNRDRVTLGCWVEPS